jgi:hypothetical protein
MGQKSNPIGNRLGFIHGWDSNWYGGNDYKDKIVEDDKRIVSSFNKKTLNLMDKFGHKKDGWHFPFYVDAESRSHLKWRLKQMFPEYKEFIFKD